jgi:MoaA/NifB/PqqE/SkfB family radical SAM enzyme
LDAKEFSLNQRNKYLALWEFAHKTTNVKSTPSSLQMARSNICNFRCVYCSDHRSANQIPRTTLEEETWRKLVDLIPRSEVLAFHGISEFMIDPEFFDIVRRCAEAGASLRINTNGSVCSPNHLSMLANYPGHLGVNFSIDAATPETYLRIRGEDFWRIIRNIRTYTEGFEARRDRTWVTLSFVIMKSNVKEMVPFVSLAKFLKVDGVVYFRMHEYESLDWQIETKAGGIFDYRKECTREFGKEYNREVGRARQTAERLGVHIELPALLTEAELRELNQ